MGDKYAFTGTRKGMTHRQMRALMLELLHYSLDGGNPELHHGGCDEGGDREAHIIALALGFRVYVHPSTNNAPPDKAYYKYTCVFAENPLPPLERNHNAVDGSHMLFATPAQKEEQMRSGTWATIRYALGRNKKQPVCGPHTVVIIHFDGTIERMQCVD